MSGRLIRRPDIALGRQDGEQHCLDAKQEGHSLRFPETPAPKGDLISPSTTEGCPNHRAP